MVSAKNIVQPLCLMILLPIACLLSFFSFFFRADTWDEVRGATLINFILVGPVWAGIVFLLMQAGRIGTRGSILVGIIGGLLVAGCHSAWTEMVLKIREGPSLTVEVAKQQLDLVQAIVDYRAENGMLPYRLKDLVPKYLAEVPAEDKIQWREKIVWYRSRILYRFGNNEGWMDIQLPKVVPQKHELSGEALIHARLAEYDRRIAADPGNLVHYTDRIAYLLSMGRRTDALETCKALARAIPEHWRPHLGLVAFADPKDRASAEKECLAWLEKHPAFIQYCYLSHYYRDHDRPIEAIGALRMAAKYSLEDLKESWSYVPDVYAFDAARFAYQQHEYELVLDLTRAWSRGMSSKPVDDLYAFRAAAELALGRMEEAKRSVSLVWPKYEKGGLWAQNLEELRRAVMMEDKTFVYDPGNSASLNGWKMFPSSDRED